MAEMTREEVLEVIREADRDHVVAELSGADMHGLDLPDIDLSCTSMQSANLRGAKLHGANLSHADLYCANLYGADLSCANLYCANLSDTNLSGTNLAYANLSGAKWYGLALDGLHRYRCLLIPTPAGWRIRVGCWGGTVDELQTLIDGDNWPESEGDEIIYYRPLLQAWIDMCRAHIEAHPNVIPELARIHGGTR